MHYYSATRALHNPSTAGAELCRFQRAESGHLIPPKFPPLMPWRPPNAPLRPPRRLTRKLNLNSHANLIQFPNVPRTMLTSA